MKFTTALLAAAFLLAAAALSPAKAAGTGTGTGIQMPQVNEHCETKCTLDHETCESDVSGSIDECEDGCDESQCSKCQENMEATALGQCHAACDACMSQCDASAEPRREGCDTNQRQCLSKCTTTE